MIPILSDFKEYLEMTEDGYKVKENCPSEKVKELKQINDEYMQNMGEALFVFEK